MFTFTDKKIGSDSVLLRRVYDFFNIKFVLERITYEKCFYDLYRFLRDGCGPVNVYIYE